MIWTSIIFLSLFKMPAHGIGEGRGGRQDGTERAAESLR